MRRWIMSGAGPRWVLLLLFYVSAASLQLGVRPPGMAPPAVSWAIYLGVGPALAATLLAGSGAWLAVFFGALFAQALVHGTALIPSVDEVVLVQCDIVVAAVAALQAVLGARLIRGLFGLPLRLRGLRDLALLVLVGGPLVGLLGFLAASLAGLIEQRALGVEVFASGMIGWVVGSASAFIVLPLALLHPWRASSLVSWRGAALPRLGPAALGCIVLSLAVTAALWGSAKNVLERHNQAQFEDLAKDATAALRARIAAYDFGLDAATSMIQSSNEVTEQDWRRFVGGIGIGAHMQGVDALGVLRTLPRSAGAGAAQDAAAPGQPSRDAAAADPLIVLSRVAPEAMRAVLDGQQLGRDPVLRRTALRARDLGEPQLTPLLDPNGKIGRVLGADFVLLNPIFIPDVPLIDQNARRTALSGWSFAIFSLKGLTSGLNGGLGRDLHLTLAEGAQTGAGARGARVLFRSDPASARLSSAYRATQTLDLFGQRWTLIWTSTRAYELGLHRLSPAIVLMIGLAFTALLAAFLLSHARREETIRQNVARKTREIAQREAETRSILDTALVKIALLDARGLIIAANDAVARSFGYRQDELPGVALDTLLEGATAEYFDQPDAATSRRSFRSLVKVISKTGERLALDVQIKAWTTEEGALRYTAVMRNISDVLRVEAQLRDTQHRLDIALRGAQIGVFDVDLATRESIVSDTWRELIGFDRDTPIDPQVEWKARIHPDDAEAVADSDRACLIGETEASITDYRMRVVNGDWRWMRSHAVVAERDQAGRALRLIGVQMDVTEERMLDRAKSEFVSTVSHELRTPLTSINGSLSLVLNAPDSHAIPERMLRLLRIAQKNCDRLIPLVNDILDLEKISSGQTRFEFTQEDLAPLLRSAITVNEPYAEKFGVRVKLVAEEGGARGRIDSNRFLQVMSNLLSNAAKFSERGGEITVRLVREDEALRVSVTDRGRGIPASFHDQIFRPFSQVDSSATRDKEGTGLGLNISKQIVERMGGQIGFRSDPGRETVFWFTVPLAGRSARAGRAAAADAPRPPPRGPAARPAVAQYHGAEGRPLVLHVEDDEDFAEILAASFRDKVELVHCDREFSLEALRSDRRFDLIVLESAQSEGADVLLLDAVTRFQPGVPVIALTSSDKAGSDPRVARTIIKSRARFEEIVSLCMAELPRAQEADPGETGAPGRVAGQG